LSEIVFYRSKDEVYKKDCPGDVFFNYTAIRSFLRACSSLQNKSKKWKVSEASTGQKSVLSQASLTVEEYKNPFIVFQNAFAEHSLADFEFFLCEVIHLALRPTIVEFDSDLLTPYIHVIKMLDASQLLFESEVEKIA
jgi:thiamine kinase-like enzyme